MSRRSVSCTVDSTNEITRKENIAEILVCNKTTASSDSSRRSTRHCNSLQMFSLRVTQSMIFFLSLLNAFEVVYLYVLFTYI